MQILLFILKIIGIILLFLLGLILFVLAMVLFVPIRYEINGEIADEHKIEAGGVIRYLFSILKLTVAYRNGELETDIYLFGFRRKKSVLDEDGSKESEMIKEAATETISEETIQEKIESEEVESEILKEECSVKKPSEEVEEHVAAAKQSESSEKTQRKVKTQPDKKKKTKTVKQNKKDENKFPFELIKKELTDEHNRNVLRKAFRELKYLITHFWFRKIKTELCFGTGDPALTGQILGILAMFPILYRYEFGITPDFETENAYIKGSFLVVGRIRLIHVLVTAVRLIFDKEVRMVIKKFMGMLNQ